jgi:hypothetical protein
MRFKNDFNEKLTNIAAALHETCLRLKKLLLLDKGLKGFLHVFLRLPFPQTLHLLHYFIPLSEIKSLFEGNFSI